MLLVGLAGSTFFYFMFGVATLHRSLAGLFLTRIGAGVFAATIPTAQAYIADCTTPQTRAKGMALVGAAFGLGFTFGPLLGAAALVFSTSVGESRWPGYTASGLSALAFLLAVFLLGESLPPEGRESHWKLLDAAALRAALAAPSIAALLLTSFISVLSFGSFESTLSLLLKSPQGGFGFPYRDVLYVFAYIGLVLSLAQGVLVRRLADRASEPLLAAGGAVVSTAGFLLLSAASQRANLVLLLAAATIEVTGFALITPSLQSLISRRSDPAQQGGVLGLAQSMGALARILGPLVSVPMFHAAVPLPYWVASALMLCAVVGASSALVRRRNLALLLGSLYLPLGAWALAWRLAPGADWELSRATGYGGLLLLAAGAVSLYLYRRDARRLPKL